MNGESGEKGRSGGMLPFNFFVGMPKTGLGVSRNPSAQNSQDESPCQQFPRSAPTTVLKDTVPVSFSDQKLLAQIKLPVASSAPT